MLKGLLTTCEDEDEDEDEDDDADLDFTAFGRGLLELTIVKGINVLELSVVSRCYVLQRFSDNIWSSEKRGLFSDGSDHLKNISVVFFWMIF